MALLGERLTGVGHRPALWSRAPLIAPSGTGSGPSPHLSLDLDTFPVRKFRPIKL